jgi:hypothetical protein
MPNNTGPGGKREWPCPLCGGRIDAVPRPGYVGRVWISCNKCRERDGLTGREWLVAIAEEGTSEPGGSAAVKTAMSWLVTYPEEVLGAPISERADNGERPDIGVLTAQVAGSHSRLMATPEALEWLEDERGLDEETATGAKLGWAPEEVNGGARRPGDGLVIPCADAHGKLANVIKRERGKYVGLKGVKARLYRPLPPKGSPWLLIEGLLDCLLCRQHGLPAVTETHGKGNTWIKRALPLVKGRRIAVAYDAEPSAEKAARSRVEQLNAAGAQAWVVRLSKLDLPHKGDLTDFFLGGGTAEELYTHIRTERTRGKVTA